MVSKPTGRQRGRPAGERRDLRDDPDCSALALGSAFKLSSASLNADHFCSHWRC
jgi:hypothetical protein